MWNPVYIPEKIRLEELEAAKFIPFCHLRFDVLLWRVAVSNYNRVVRVLL